MAKKKGMSEATKERLRQLGKERWAARKAGTSTLVNTTETLDTNTFSGRGAEDAAGTNALLLDLAAQVAKLVERQEATEKQVAETARATIRFQPMSPEQGPLRPVADPAKPADDPTNVHNKQLPVAVNGVALSDQTRRQFVQRFQQGDWVSIRRDSPVHQRTGDRTWADVFDVIPPMRCSSKRDGCQGTLIVGGSCDTCGRRPFVRRVLWLSKDGDWKYKVVVPGMTSNLGDGFYDFELEPARAG